MENDTQELEFMKELIKRKDEELQELKEKLTQRDKVISFLICDTRQSRFTDLQETSDSAGSGNIKENKQNKFDFSMKETRNLREIIDKIEEIKVHHNNCNRNIEEMTQDVISNVKSLKIKLDDETRKTDEIKKTVLNNEIIIEELNVKIGHSDQEMKELKNELIAHNHLLTQPNVDVGNGENGMRQLTEKVDSIEKNVKKLTAMFENVSVIVSALGGTKNGVIEQTEDMKNMGNVSQEVGSGNQEVSELDDAKKEVCEINKEVENMSRIVQEVNSNYECMVKNVHENEIETSRGSHDLEKKQLCQHIKGIADYDKVLYESEEKAKQKLCEIEALKKEFALLKEHTSTQDRKICGLDHEITNALKTEDWRGCVEIIKIATPEHDTVYKQLQNVNSHKNLPLTAAAKGYAELIQVLLRNGLDVNEKMASTKISMLHSAAHYGKNNVVELLLSKGADIDLRDNDGCAPLLWACAGNAKTAQLLIEKGANINATDNNGCTALHYAIKNVLVVQCLLDNNCNREIKNNDGKLALDIARENGYMNVVRILDKK